MKRFGIFAGLTALGMFTGYVLIALYWTTMTLLPIVMMYGMLPPDVKGFIVLGGLAGMLFGAYYAGVRFYLKG
jgi:hypothetical protein